MLSSIYVESLFFKKLSQVEIYMGVKKRSARACDILISDKLYNYFLIHGIN